MNNDIHMNPNFPKARGAFLDKRAQSSIKLVDYPTWSSKNSRITYGDANKPIPEGLEFEKPFATVHDAVEYAKSENYVICADPWTKPNYDKNPYVQQDDTED